MTDILPWFFCTSSEIAFTLSSTNDDFITWNLLLFLCIIIMQWWVGLLSISIHANNIICSIALPRSSLFPSLLFPPYPLPLLYLSPFYLFFNWYFIVNNKCGIHYPIVICVHSTFCPILINILYSVVVLFS